ncbi:MAG: isoleucine--tRNA ligase [Rickettsiales bacterium]|jgi:isoleucyl-tRNA synthetase|nr:isoleucine--tRNA ligase [Rickettsiales bacterium]
MSYPKTEPKADFVKLEHEILDFWQTNDIFHKSLEQTKHGAPFSFYDGPPFANGLPHWGHLGVSAFKDLVCRYQTMKGRYADREFGWDCHGFPAENSVEKQQGKQAKDIVAQDGIAAFCDMCRADVSKYTKEWMAFIARIGRWVEMGDGKGYRTMDKNYMESVIWGLSELYKKGLLYKDYKVNPFDWKFGSILSNSEASADYRDVVDDAITVWFELEDGRRVLAWTTTPWTLPGNSALAANPKMKYAVMKDFDGKEYVIAESRLDSYEKQFSKAKKIGEITGADLVGLKYKPMFDYYDDDKLFRILGADFVSDSDGTGIVHIAPAFGEEDYLAAKKLDPKFPVIVNVDDYGNFTAEVRDWAGKNIFEATPGIMEYLKKAGFLVKKEQYKHSYPYGERSKEKLIYRATEAWYIDVPKIGKRLIENNEKVKWTSAGKRFADWIANARPWGITRNRFWGVPLPIWSRENEFKIFGSIKEMEEFFGVKINDLHRPTLDALEKDGWKRIADVLDCWVESGSMPWARLHYPFENKDIFDAAFPADYIVEGLDQTRGWFYSLMVLATALFDGPAFKTVSVNGLIVDENRKKLSKSLGNFVNPEQQIEQFGADAIRLFVLGSNFMKAEPLSIDKKGNVFNESIKTILTPLWNAYHFFTLYANAGKIKVSDGKKSELTALDSYILAEFDELARIANDALDSYAPERAVAAITKFLDILNNWYIRRSRERFWNEEQGAFNTLHTVLTEFCKILAPFAPFASDYIFKNLTGKESVHLEKYPQFESAQNGTVARMRKAQDIVAVGKSLREKHGLRNRLPLAKITIVGAANALPDNDSRDVYGEIIKDELNVKEIAWSVFLRDVADSFIFPITPKIAERLGGAALKDILPAIKDEKYKIDDGRLIINDYVLKPDEFEIRLNVKSGIAGAALPDNTAVVILDTNLTPKLIAEGLANDALRFIQDTRKAINLDVSDRIKLFVAGDAEIVQSLKTLEQRVKEETLATEIIYADEPLEHKTKIENHDFSIRIF